MGYIAVDLGSTNIKVAAYQVLNAKAAYLSRPVQYFKRSSVVEFDADAYCDAVLDMIAEHIRCGNIFPSNVNQIVFTGQAESLVVLGKNGKPLMNAISWMDERSVKECEELARLFSPDTCYKVTGQKAVLPTWPATKILHIKHNLPEVYNNATHYVLLKDYIVYRLTGVLCSECSIATFSFYFDIHNRRYWQDMLDACGIYLDQLPPLVEPCTNVGTINTFTAERTGLHTHTTVNVGTLDHFAGMIGTGNVHEGIISVSMGTVMALATFAHKPFTGKEHIALHYGFEPGTHVFLSVVESGGVCLEWFKNAFMPNYSYGEIDSQIEKRGLPNELIFLPYITGTNAPEFDADACGMFFGIRSKHDSIDFAYAVMEGVAHLLAKNASEIAASGIGTKRIIITGGGAKSALWCQLMADITGIPVELPLEKEAACLGAAIIGAVDDGVYNGLTHAVQGCVHMSKHYEPCNVTSLMNKHLKFNILYDSMLKVTRM